MFSLDSEKKKIKHKDKVFKTEMTSQKVIVPGISGRAAEVV